MIGIDKRRALYLCHQGFQAARSGPAQNAAIAVGNIERPIRPRFEPQRAPPEILNHLRGSTVDSVQFASQISGIDLAIRHDCQVFGTNGPLWQHNQLQRRHGVIGFKFTGQRRGLQRPIDLGGQGNRPKGQIAQAQTQPQGEHRQQSLSH